MLRVGQLPIELWDCVNNRTFYGLNFQYSTVPVGVVRYGSRVLLRAKGSPIRNNPAVCK